jgi:hypothetical protein
MHKFCKCGGSVLTIEQMETDQLCQRCREEQIRNLPDKEVKKEEE